MAQRRGPMPRVEFDGSYYALLSRKTVVPDLYAMPRFEALQWLCANTRPRGYQQAPNPLRGYGGRVSAA